MNKPKTCKCGHEHPYFKLYGVRRSCKECYCNNFIDTRFPQRSDKIIYGVMVACLGLVTTIFVSGFFATNYLLNFDDPTLDMPTFTLRHVLSFSMAAFAVLSLCFGGWCYDSVFEYHHKKRTKASSCEKVN